MIALDTNVLVRFLVRDDAAQARRARALIERGIEAGDRFFFSDIVLCETVWVLDRAYAFTRSEIISALRALVSARHAVFESTARIRAAIDRYAVGKGDFSDYLIAETAFAAGCTAIATFDRALHADSRFRKV